MGTDELPGAAGDVKAGAIELQVETFLSLWFRARQRIMQINFKHAHRQGLSVTQFLVLNLLGQHRGDAPWTISTLAEQLNLDPATLVRTVDSLEQRALVTRRRDLRDRRLVFVELTTHGRGIQQDAIQQITVRLATMFRAMSTEGREALLRGLEELVAVDQHPDDGEDHSLQPPCFPGIDRQRGALTEGGEE